jgi:hypothetical protein
LATPQVVADEISQALRLRVATAGAGAGEHSGRGRSDRQSDVPARRSKVWARGREGVGGLGEGVRLVGFKQGGIPTSRDILV